MTISPPSPSGAVTFIVSMVKAETKEETMALTIQRARYYALLAAGGDTIITPNSAIMADAQQYLAQSGERKKIHFAIMPEVGAISQP